MPEHSARGRGMVCAVDGRAAAAGAAMLDAGGNAADAIIACSAVLAVTTPHMCGMGGDLFAMVHHRDASGPPACLNSSGRAGSGADAARLRAEGHRRMPFRGDIRSVPVPGCVDGWVALSRDHGHLDLATVLEPAQRFAVAGFGATDQLAAASRLVADLDDNTDLGASHILAEGDLVVRPGSARALDAIAHLGRAGFYQGEFGESLLRLGAGEFSEADLALPLAEWVEPLGVDLWGHRVWTVPPNSQGYLTLTAAVILADLLEEQSSTGAGAASEAQRLHLAIEAMRHAAFDRSAVLAETTDAAALLEPTRLAERRRQVMPDRAAVLHDTYTGGGTIYCCAADSDGMGVSLIQSNAAGFGAHIVVPGTGIFLQNRGIGFSLEAGHPAEYGPGRRPPSTLSPALVANTDGGLHALVGSMGGDGQPQIVLQLLTHLLLAGSSPAEALARPRWVLESPGNSGFSTWDAPDEAVVVLQPEAAPLADELRAKGHKVEVRPTNVGHAQVIAVSPGVDPQGALWDGAAEPRVSTAAAVPSRR